MQGFPLRPVWAIVGGVLVSILTGLHPGAASAQSAPDRSAELERKLDRALQVIEDLSARIRQLETGATGRQTSPTRISESPPSAPPAAEGAPVQPPQEPAPERGARLTPPEDHHTGLGLRIPGLGIPLRGFVDLGGGANNAKGKPQGFALGSLDFYLTPRFGDQAMGLAELVFEYDDKGELTADLERLQLGYTFRDELTTWLGRFHTPLGYWNTAFHHGRYLMTSATRPEFLEFEDRKGILPVHTVGLWGTGRVAIGNGKVTYDAFVGNSPTIEDGVLNPLNIGRRNLNLMTGVNAGYSFGGALEGLQLGVHWLRGDVHQEGSDQDRSATTTLSVWGGYLAYNNYDWEILAEYYLFDNRDKSGATGSHRSWAGFVQAGRTLGLWTLYGRFEMTDFDQRDSYFSRLTGGRSYEKGVVGVRYELTPRAALKLELSRRTTTDPLRRNENSLEVQYSGAF